ncbi:MAG: hypothetical protein EOM50_04185 [Erysipelotrichia bacterium]|nr:hypothetical protein [Erysipelotrichia bacterium]NCC54484.1 hypothetical protein [Erysipelotrichia bacterium]
MSDTNMDDFKRFEEDTKLALIRLEDATEDSKAKRMIEAIRAELERWFSDVKRFIEEHKDSEKVQETLDNVKKETEKVIKKLKVKIDDVKEDDKVKEFIDSTLDSLDDLRVAINENDTFVKVKQSVVNTFENIKNDENVKDGVKKVKKTTLQFAQKALSKVEKALAEDDDEIIVHTIKKESDED